MIPSATISHLTAGRSQIGTSLSFHLFFAVLGVGLPLMMLVAEGMHLRTGDPVWRALARRWSKVFAVLFAVGAVSGTIISFELGLLFPRFLAYAGGIIGLPFSLEGAARADLRQAWRRAERDGASFEVIPRERIAEVPDRGVERCQVGWIPLEAQEPGRC